VQIIENNDNNSTIQFKDNVLSESLRLQLKDALTKSVEVNGINYRPDSNEKVSFTIHPSLY